MDLFRYIELGAVALLAIGLLQIVRVVLEKILAQQAAREIAWRKDASVREERIAGILDNHLGSIGVNQAKTAEALDLIVNRLLDAALPVKKVKHGS